jgi:DNA-binding transcriptional ArsR family regulator
VVRRGQLLTVLDCDANPLVRDPLTAEQAASVAALFKALSDPVRLRLLSLIASHAGGEACVCDLTPAFDVSEPTISHHLKVLREAGAGHVGAARLVGLLPARSRRVDRPVGAARCHRCRDPPMSRSR